jgi:lipoprotein-releasing system ATP-binding protein
MSNILELHEVTKRYQSQGESLLVLDGVNLTVTRGSTLSIVGESGSGKSTLLHLIAGLDTVSGGLIISCGIPVSEMKEDELTNYRLKMIGMIFQFHFLLPELNVLENVMLPAWILGKSRQEAERMARSLLDETGMNQRLFHYPYQLSGGERQRTALARALINQPELILADEPTGNLDEENARLVEDLLLRLVKDHQQTLILVTHNTQFADRVEKRYRMENRNLWER